MKYDKVRALDGKFSLAVGDDGKPVILNTRSGKPIPDDEPVFVLRGKDALTPVALQNYAALLLVARAASEDIHFGVMAEAVTEQAKLIEGWQINQPGGARMPD